MSIEKPVKIELKTYVCDYRQGWKTVDYIRGCNDTIDQSDKYWEQKLSVFMEEMTEIRDYGDMDEEIYNLIRGKIHKITKE